MFILSKPENTLDRPRRLFAGLHHHEVLPFISGFLLVSFTLTMTGIPALVTGAQRDRTHRVQNTQGNQDRTYAPQVTLSDFGKCYATTDPVVRDVAQGAGVVQVGEALPDGGLRTSSRAISVRVPEALADVRQLLQSNRPFIQAFCTVCLPECPATATLSDRATFAAAHVLRAPGAAVLAQPYGPFLGAGANPLSATIREVQAKWPAITSRRLDPSERLTAELLRCTPQSGVPPGERGNGMCLSPYPGSLTPHTPWRSSPQVIRELSAAPGAPGPSADAPEPAGPAGPNTMSILVHNSQRAG